MIFWCARPMLWAPTMQQQLQKLRHHLKELQLHQKDVDAAIEAAKAKIQHLENSGGDE